VPVAVGAEQSQRDSEQYSCDKYERAPHSSVNPVNLKLCLLLGPSEVTFFVQVKLCRKSRLRIQRERNDLDIGATTSAEPSLILVFRSALRAKHDSFQLLNQMTENNTFRHVALFKQSPDRFDPILVSSPTGVYHKCAQQRNAA